MSGRPRWPYVEDLVKSSLAIYFQGLHRKYGSGSWNSFDSQKCRHWKFWSIYISDASLPRQTDVLPCQTCLAMILMIWYDILPVKPCFPRLTYASGNGERWLLFHFSFPMAHALTHLTTVWISKKEFYSFPFIFSCLSFSLSFPFSSYLSVPGFLICFPSPRSKAVFITPSIHEFSDLSHSPESHSIIH